jgi:hypothetical protein
MKGTKETAQILHAMGTNITAIAGDGKAPKYRWKADINERQTDARVQSLPWSGYTRKDGTTVPAARRVGVIHSDTVGQWRCFDIDACKADGGKTPVSTGVASAVLRALGLIDDYESVSDYEWCLRSGSGAGWHIYVRCEDALPDGVGVEKAKEKGVYTGGPREPGAFDHIELRWHGCQSVPAFTSEGCVPYEAPELVSGDQIAGAFAAVAERPTASPALPAPRNDDDTVRLVKERLDLVDVANKLYGEGKREGDEIRYEGNGGLLVNADKQQWYCHQTECGGDVLNLICYHRYGTVNGDKERFKDVLKEAARWAGVELGARASDRSRGGRGAHGPATEPATEPTTNGPYWNTGTATCLCCAMACGVRLWKATMPARSISAGETWYE